MLFAWWLVSISLVLTPGPDWAYTISAGLRDRAIVPAISGTLLGYATITALVAAGVGSLVTTVPAVLTGLTLVGAGYLLWLGAGILVRPPVAAMGTVEGSGNWVGWMARGFATTGTNPKALLLFLALLPQFTSASAPWPIGAQICVMGLVLMLNCAVVYSGVGLGAKALMAASPRVAERLSQISGAVMLLVAVMLLAEQVQAWAVA